MSETRSGPVLHAATGLYAAPQMQQCAAEHDAPLSQHQMYAKTAAKCSLLRE